VLLKIERGEKSESDKKGNKKFIKGERRGEDVKMGIFDNLFGKKKVTESKRKYEKANAIDEIATAEIVIRSHFDWWKIIPIRSYFDWWRSLANKLISYGIDPTMAGWLVNIHTNGYCPNCNSQYTKDALSILLDTSLRGGIGNVTIIPEDSIFVGIPNTNLPKDAFEQLFNYFRCPKCGDSTIKLVYEEKKLSVKEIVNYMEKEPSNVDGYTKILIKMGQKIIPELIECYKKYSPNDVENDSKFSVMVSIIQVMGSVGGQHALNFLKEISKTNYKRDYVNTIIKENIKKLEAQRAE